MPKEPTPHRGAPAHDAPLPPERAFIVQLRAESGPGADRFVGRLEHIASGEARRFGSAAELLGLIAEMDGARRPRGKGDETP